MSYIIVLDIGTTFLKAAVACYDGTSARLLKSYRKPFPNKNPGPLLHFEVQPQSVVNEVRSLLESLVSDNPEVTKWDGIFTSTQMHGLVLVDRELEPLSNIITWQDQRALQPHPDGGSYFEVVMSQLSVTETLAVGNGLRAALPVCVLYWMSVNNMLVEDAMPLTLSEFVLARLCTTPDPKIHPTNAQGYGCFNLETGTWHAAILKKLGLELLSWPAIANTSGDVIGLMSICDFEIPVYTSIGDQQASIAGTFLHVGEVSLNISTGSQASTITDEVQVNEAYECRPYLEGRFLNTLVQLPAGRSLSALVKLLVEIPMLAGTPVNDPWSVIIEAIEHTTSTDLNVDLAFFETHGRASGSINNVREDNLSVGHLFLGAITAMADAYADSAITLGCDAHTGIVFSGGLVQKLERLRTEIVAAFQRKELPNNFRTCIVSEDALLGLLVFGLCALSYAENLTAASKMIQEEEH